MAPGPEGFVIVAETSFSTIRWADVPRGLTGGEVAGDRPETILPLVIARLRTLNREPHTPARELAMALQRSEEALHWLHALNDRRAVAS